MSRLGNEEKREGVLHNLKYIRQSRKKIEEEIRTANSWFNNGVISKKEYSGILC